MRKSEQDLSTVAGRLHAVMADRGMRTVAEVARAVGIKEVTMRSYTNGMRTPPPDQCAKIGAALGVSAEWLAHGEGGPEAPVFTMLRPSEFISVAVEELCIIGGHPPALARELGAAIGLIVTGQPKAPAGMSQEAAVRRLVRYAVSHLLPQALER